MNYPGYFLIVWDFIKYARDNGIPVGPGRGSATGSLVAYAMEITNIDPMQNVLLFERFLNPERVTMPDVDVDFCMNRRGEVIEYVTRKYGREQVAQIITFNTMAAKASIKDCGRAMDMPYGDVDRIAKLVPATVGMTLDNGRSRNRPSCARAYDNDKTVRELIDTAKKAGGAGAGRRRACLRGGHRAPAAHGTGAAEPHQERRNRHRVRHESRREDGPAEDGLPGPGHAHRHRRGVKLIEQTRGEKLDIEMIPLDDPETFRRVFHTALTSGVFQFESSGMRDILRRYKPDTVEELTQLERAFPARARWR